MSNYTQEGNYEGHPQHNLGAGTPGSTDAARMVDLGAYTPLTLGVTAGAGLTGGGVFSSGTLIVNVGANADGSIVVNANDIQIGVLATDGQHGTRGGGALHALVTTTVAGFMSAADKVKLDGLSAGTVPTSRVVTAGAGLMGGGDLSADRTFNVGANADGSIVVNADDVQVGIINDTQHGARGGGTLHALVVNAGAAGFMSGADKAKLDGLPASAVDTGTQVIAGAGLTGGGALSGSVTLNVIAHVDGSIVVHADDVQVGVLASDAQHGTRGGGTIHAAATTSAAGFMSAFDKNVLTNATFVVRTPTAAPTGAFALSTLSTGLLLNTGGVLTTAVVGTDYASPAVAMTAGAGLTGGGDLSSGRTFNVGANADGSIVVNADDIQRAGISGDVSIPLGSNTSTIAASSVSFAKIQTIGSDLLLGRDTGGVGAVETITVGGGLEFTGSGGIHLTHPPGLVATGYGNGTQVAAFAVDVTGRLTTAIAVDITGSPSDFAVGNNLTVSALATIAGHVNANAGMSITGGILTAGDTGTAFAVPNGNADLQHDLHIGGNLTIDGHVDTELSLTQNLAFTAVVTQQIQKFNGDLIVKGDAAFNVSLRSDALEMFGYDHTHVGIFGARTTRFLYGAATAGGTYTAAEQLMLQRLWDMVRSLGLNT